MNIYQHTFSATCPKNDRRITYALTVRSGDMVMVEEIVQFCLDLRSGFHEDFADRLFRRFGGTQVLHAHHHGVDITTIRGAA